MFELFALNNYVSLTLYLFWQHNIDGNNYGNFIYKYNLDKVIIICNNCNNSSVVCLQDSVAVVRHMLIFINSPLSSPLPKIVIVLLEF